jgi:hypothetical protein
MSLSWQLIWQLQRADEHVILYSYLPARRRAIVYCAALNSLTGQA